MRVPLPKYVTRTISESAVRKAQSDIRGRGWKSANAIHPFYKDGLVGLRSSLKYLIFQSRGTRPRLMRELEGKTIPFKDEAGTRFVKVKGVGQPGFVTLPGGEKVWRDQKWRHPGIKPKRFLEDSITSAIRESRGLIQKSAIEILAGESSDNSRT